MAQYDDLELLGLIRARAQQNQFQHAPQRDVKHRPEHEQTPGSLTKTGHATRTEARDRVYAPHSQSPFLIWDVPQGCVRPTPALFLGPVAPVGSRACTELLPDGASGCL